jgi:hypothetical protein
MGELQIAKILSNGSRNSENLSQVSTLERIHYVRIGRRG